MLKPFFFNHCDRFQFHCRPRKGVRTNESVGLYASAKMRHLRNLMFGAFDADC
jgi:hypothetical protein